VATTGHKEFDKPAPPVPTPTRALLMKLARLKTDAEEGAQDWDVEGASVLEREDMDELIVAARAVLAGKAPVYR
jgi:hypothetical protein